jgi:chlorophyllide a oxygenase
MRAQVLGEDLVLILGQQDRLERGGDTWSFPVSYDKLAVRYRRWRNANAEGNGKAAAEYATQVCFCRGCCACACTRS